MSNTILAIAIALYIEDNCCLLKWTIRIVQQKCSRTARNLLWWGVVTVWLEPHRHESLKLRPFLMVTSALNGSFQAWPDWTRKAVILGPTNDEASRTEVLVTTRLWRNRMIGHGKGAPETLSLYFRTGPMKQCKGKTGAQGASRKAQTSAKLGFSA